MRATTTTLGQLVEHVENVSRGNFDETIPSERHGVHKSEGDVHRECWGRGPALRPNGCLPTVYGSPSPTSTAARPTFRPKTSTIGLSRRRRSATHSSAGSMASTRFRAVFTDRYTAIDHGEILSKMVEIGFRPEQQVQYMLDDRMMVVKVPDYGRQFEVALKDNVVPGVSIANGETGYLSFCIECFFLRLVCTNGMVAPVSIGQSRFKHISRKAFEELPETIRQVAQESDGQRAKMVISVNTPVHNPIQSIESFNKRFGLTASEGELVKASWEQEPLQTMWGVIQAYTGAARAPELAVDVSYRLERVGGQLLSMVKNN